MPDIEGIKELPPEPEELREERYWNMWVAIGAEGLVGADPKLGVLLDRLEAVGVPSDVTTLFNTPPSDSIIIY